VNAASILDDRIEPSEHASQDALHEAEVLTRRPRHRRPHPAVVDERGLEELEVGRVHLAAELQELDQAVAENGDGLQPLPWRPKLPRHSLAGALDPRTRLVGCSATFELCARRASLRLLRRAGPQRAGRRIVGRSQPHPLLLVEHGGQLELRVKPVQSGLEGSAHSQHADDFAGEFFFDGDRVLV
jgi:hypothetical protein